MKLIDVKTWNRKSSYENFIGYTHPAFSVCTRLNVTKLYDFCKKNGKSFFITMTYITAKCLNEIEQFRMRLVDGGIALYDTVSPSYVVIANDGAITSCKTEFVSDFETFHENALADIERTRKEGSSKKFNAGNVDLFFISSVKWSDFTAINHPYDFKNQPQSSIPRIAWGKIIDNGNKKEMAFDISAHHALLDGEPLCFAFNKIQAEIDKL